MNAFQEKEQKADLAFKPWPNIPRLDFNSANESESSESIIENNKQLKEKKEESELLQTSSIMDSARPVVVPDKEVAPSPKFFVDIDQKNSKPVSLHEISLEDTLKDDR